MQYQNHWNSQADNRHMDTLPTASPASRSPWTCGRQASGRGRAEQTEREAPSECLAVGSTEPATARCPCSRGAWMRGRGRHESCRQQPRGTGCGPRGMTRLLQAMTSGLGAEQRRQSYGHPTSRATLGWRVIVPRHPELLKEKYTEFICRVPEGSRRAAVPAPESHNLHAYAATP